MITRTTTIGTLKGYRYNLNVSNNSMAKSMNTVVTRRSFNSYAEDPALATRCFQLRNAYMRTKSQLTVNNSVWHKYDQAWQALDNVSTDVYALADDTVFGSLIRGENQPTAAARQALGQSMSAKAESIVQTMNTRYGENYIFSGADTLNVPFTWGPRENPDYIAPEKLDPADPDHAKYFRYETADGASLTNDAAEAANPPVENPAFDATAASKYLRDDGTGTNSPQLAESVLYYRGVAVDSMEDSDQEKLKYFDSEKKYMDLGLGYKEEDGKAVDSSVFDATLQGVYYLGGYGTEEVEVTIDDKLGPQKVTVPNNIVSIISRMGTILQRCNSDDGDFATKEDEAEFQALAHKFEDTKDLLIQRRTELDTETGFLRDNTELLTNTAETLNLQITELEDVDPAMAITEYMFARYAYDTALKVGNSILSQSLMDYMSF